MRLVFLGVALLGCLNSPSGGPPPEAPVIGAADARKTATEPRVLEAALGVPFELRLGDSARLASTRLELRFDAVVEDSRCPADVTCVWAGNAHLRLTASLSGTPTVLDLHTHGGASYPRQACVGRRGEGSDDAFTMSLLSAHPEPSAGKRPERERQSRRALQEEPRTTEDDEAQGPREHDEESDHEGGSRARLTVSAGCRS
ncbi:MAG TPA: hypothetical protein VNB06_17615 [Thermoanaerobaculia bacterium]|nr:hypothetical protein [Thermoanaerobaculia bacterium]